MDWHKYFTYDAVAGVLIWKNRPIDEFIGEREWKIWNTSRAGRVAACEARTKEGVPMSVVVGCNKFKPQTMRAHRIIWEMHYGRIPEKMEIDHRDGNPFNNKLSNLRIATSAQNGCNSRVRSHSKSRLKGVHYRENRPNPWRAAIKVMGGKVKYLGHFPTKGLAAVAYAKAALRYHGEYFRVQ